MAFKQISQGNPASITSYLGPIAPPGVGGPVSGPQYLREPSAEVVVNEARLAFERDQLNKQTEQAAANRAADQFRADADRNAQLAIGMAPWQFKDKVFQTVSPLLTGLLGGANGTSGIVGGQSTPQPGVDAGPIWNPQQVNQQVNSAKASNAMNAETEKRKLAGSTAAQGFGSKSPLLAALQTGVDNARMGADADADRQIRWDAAGGNADHVLKAQTQNQNAWRDFNQIDVERLKSNRQYVTSLVSALGGLG